MPFTTLLLTVDVIGPALLRPGRGPENGEPEVTGDHFPWDKILNFFQADMTAWAATTADPMIRKFFAIFRTVTKTGELALAWKEWAEEYISELEAALDRSEEAMNDHLDAKFRAQNAELDRKFAKLEVKIIKMNDTELGVYWKNLEAGLKAKHEVFKAIWVHNADCPTQLAYIVEGQLSLNFDHPYLQGYLFGVWLKSSKALMNHDSVWFQMDMKPFHEEEWGLCSPQEDTAFTWFSGIRDGSKGVDVREFLARRGENELFQDIEAKSAYAVFDPRPPVWLYHVEEVPKWLSKEIE